MVEQQYSQYAIKLTAEDIEKNGLTDAVGTIKVFNPLPIKWGDKYGFKYEKDLSKFGFYPVEPITDPDKVGSELYFTGTTFKYIEVDKPTPATISNLDLR